NEIDTRNILPDPIKQKTAVNAD
ncbi:hypothetical protein Tco_0069912, partial [Tanacetum coccineum]